MRDNGKGKGGCPAGIYQTGFALFLPEYKEDKGVKREYEITLIAHPELSPEDVPKALEKIKGVIEDKGGEIKEVKDWGRRKFAYPILRSSKRYTEGNYFYIEFLMEPEKTRELESTLNLVEECFRYLIVRKDRRR